MRPTNGTPRGAVNTFRVVIPVALIVIGILTIAGCIYIPVSEQPYTPTGRDVRRVAGDLGSNKPLRVGAANRDMVLRLLGPPTLRSAGDLAIGYDCRTIIGHHFGLCVDSNGEAEVGQYLFFVPGNVYAHHLLFLEFDRNGLLKRYQLSRLEYGRWEVEPAWKDFIRTLPAEPVEPTEPVEPPEKQRATTEP